MHRLALGGALMGPLLAVAACSAFGADDEPATSAVDGSVPDAPGTVDTSIADAGDGPIESLSQELDCAAFGAITVIDAPFDKPVASATLFGQAALATDGLHLSSMSSGSGSVWFSDSRAQPDPRAPGARITFEVQVAVDAGCQSGLGLAVGWDIAPPVARNIFGICGDGATGTGFVLETKSASPAARVASLELCSTTVVPGATTGIQDLGLDPDGGLTSGWHAVVLEVAPKRVRWTVSGAGTNAAGDYDLATSPTKIEAAKYLGIGAQTGVGATSPPTIATHTIRNLRVQRCPLKP